MDRIQVIGSDTQLAALQNALEKEVRHDDWNIEKREMKLRQLIIGQGSPFIGLTLEESGLRSFYNCMVVGLEEGREYLSPFKPTRRFEEGDIIWIVGEEADLDRLIKL